MHANGKFSVGADSNSWFATKNGDGTNIFTTPAAGTFTPQRNRNILYGPGSANYNASLQKRFQTFENQFLTFRFDAFNFPNHPQLVRSGFNLHGRDLRQGHEQDWTASGAGQSSLLLLTLDHLQDTVRSRAGGS